MKKVIDQKLWPRKAQYDLFRSMMKPHFNITARVDCTRVMEQTKARGGSVFAAVLFAIMKAANHVPEFRTRISGEDVLEFDLIHPSFTVPIENDQFAFCEMDYQPNWETFEADCREAVEMAGNQPTLRENTSHRLDWVYLSCIPWLDFTGSAHPHFGPEDSIPRISWGKISPQNNKWEVPVCVELHHALADGIHMSYFFKQLQDELDRIT